MESGIRLSSKSSLRKNRTKNSQKVIPTITSAIYIKAFEVLINFNNGEQRLVNFLPLFANLSGAFTKYCQLSNFKKFIVKNGNVYWGKNEDVIFPVQLLYSGKQSKMPKEEILYIL